MFQQLIELIKKHGTVFLAIVITVTPIVWQIASLHFSERIEAVKAEAIVLNNHIALLRDEKAALVEKLRQCCASSLSQSTQPENHTSVSTPAESNLSTQSTSRLPHIADSARPTKEEVRELARFYGLSDNWKVNPHLQFKEGDISYWSEQGLTGQELTREFESRQTVLRQAETSGEKIPSQGDLSYKAERLQAISRTP